MNRHKEMKHLDFFSTPVERLDYFSKLWGVNLYCKRDDLFMAAGGGSKARMLQYILYPLVRDKVEVLITAGGPCSNYNRAAALMCARLGIRMRLVSYTDNEAEYETSLNHYLVRLAGVELTFCSKRNVPEVIQDMIRQTEKDGRSYRYLYGGGKSLEGVFAYYDAVRELREQLKGNLDEVYVACGTGTTLTGICAGMREYFPEAVVHGISVARPWDVEKEVLEEDMTYIRDYTGKNYDFTNLKFHDEFLLGGYGKTSQEELTVIQEVVSKEGMLVDPTYSGKAFYGMSNLVAKDVKKNVLFWNTGGMMNLLSYNNGL